MPFIFIQSLALFSQFSATYPSPTGKLGWKITKKELRLKNRDFTTGQRLFAWISITFEEADDSGGEPKIYKIEGFIKPVIQHGQE